VPGKHFWQSLCDAAPTVVEKVPSEHGVQAVIEQQPPA
jgi:hypothetical protein